MAEVTYGGAQRTSLDTLEVYPLQPPDLPKVAGRVSEMYNIAVGLAQGSPLSGFCFTAFLDDLATLSKEENIGVEFLDATIVGVFLMDDLSIFAPDEKTMQKALDLLSAYSQTWRIPYAPPPKSGVMCFYAKCDVLYWPLCDMHIPTETSCRILGIFFSDDGKWTTHATDRRHKSEGRFNSLRDTGLLCGDLPFATQTTYMNSIIWSASLYGRAATTVFATGHSDERNTQSTIHVTLCRRILGASSKAPAEGVLGELGWWLDGCMTARHCLLFANRLAAMNECTWQFKCYRGAKNSPQSLLRRYIDYLKGILGLKGTLPVDPASWKTQLKAKLPKWAQDEWRRLAKDHPRLRLYTQYKKSLTPPLYTFLSAFPGRESLVQARINDLCFDGERKYGCPYCAATLPLTNDEGEIEAQIHLFVSCPGSSHPLARFLLRASRWLPTGWSSYAPRTRLAHLLLLPERSAGALSPEAARLTGAYLEMILDTLRMHAKQQRKKNKKRKSDTKQQDRRKRKGSLH